MHPCVHASPSLQVPFFEWSQLATAAAKAEYMERKFRAAAEALLPAVLAAEKEAREATVSVTSNSRSGKSVDMGLRDVQHLKLPSVSGRTDYAGFIKQDVASEDNDSSSPNDAVIDAGSVRKETSQVPTRERLRTLAATKVLKPHRQSRVRDQSISRSSAGALTRSNILNHAKKLSQVVTTMEESEDQ